MASDESMTALPSVHSSMYDLDVDSYPHDDDQEATEGEKPRSDAIQLSRLSLQSTWEGDADAGFHSHLSVDDDGSGDDNEADGGGAAWCSITNSHSLVSDRTRRVRQRGQSTKEYSSESEVSWDRYGGRTRSKSCAGARGSSSPSYSSCLRRRTRITREKQLDLAWKEKRCHWGGDHGCGNTDNTSGGSSPCVVVRTTGPGAGSMLMDMEEVKACRDLGLELPCDWSVEIPPSALTAVATTEATSATDSPESSWRVSSPGEDPGDMRARLRVWAQAVALTCLPPEQLS